MIALISHVLFKIIHCFNIILIDPMEKSLIRLPWVEETPRKPRLYNKSDT